MFRAIDAERDKRFPSLPEDLHDARYKFVQEFCATIRVWIIMGNDKPDIEDILEKIRVKPLPTDPFRKGSKRAAAYAKWLESQGVS